MKKFFLLFIISNLVFANIIKVYTTKRFIDLEKYIPYYNNNRYFINIDKNYYKLLGLNFYGVKYCKLISHFLVCRFNKHHKLDLIVQEINLKTKTIKDYYFYIFNKDDTNNIIQYKSFKNLTQRISSIENYENRKNFFISNKRMEKKTVVLKPIFNKNNIQNGNTSGVKKHFLEKNPFVVNLINSFIYYTNYFNFFSKSLCYIDNILFSDNSFDENNIPLGEIFNFVYKHNSFLNQDLIIILNSNFNELNNKNIHLNKDKTVKNKKLIIPKQNKKKKINKKTYYHNKKIKYKNKNLKQILKMDFNTNTGANININTKNHVNTSINSSLLNILKNNFEK